MWLLERTGACSLEIAGKGCVSAAQVPELLGGAAEPLLTALKAGTLSFTLSDTAGGFCAEHSYALSHSVLTEGGPYKLP